MVGVLMIGALFLVVHVETPICKGLCPLFPSFAPRRVDA